MVWVIHNIFVLILIENTEEPFSSCDTYRDMYRDMLVPYRDISRYNIFGDTNP